jgi:hypothetical protein
VQEDVLRHVDKSSWRCQCDPCTVPQHLDRDPLFVSLFFFFFFFFLGGERGRKRESWQTLKVASFLELSGFCEAIDVVGGSSVKDVRLVGARR